MNKMMEMFDLKEIRQMIKKCPKDELLILCPHWSINKPKYTNEECEEDNDNWDWYEMEEKLGYNMQINDFDDLVIDVHGLLNF